MRDRAPRRPARRRTGAAILATAVVSLVLVVATSGTSTSAAPVNATVPTSCTGRDAATNNTLALAAGLLGSDRLGVNLVITGGDVPENAGLEQEIDAGFNWSATLDQTLIDAAASLIPAITVSNVSVTQQVKGPVTPNNFSGANPGPVTLTPKAGVAASLPIGKVGGIVTTTGGGIVTYRVGSLSLDVSLTITGIGSFDLKLKCDVPGSNIFARTSVRDPDAPVFDPEIVELEAEAGETVSVDLLGEVVTPGKTPLLPESLKIVEQPAGGSASVQDGTFSFTAPDEPGTYTATVEVCGAPKDEAGTPGINETQLLTFGENWIPIGTGGGLPIVGQALSPRPIAFTLKVGGQETRLIWTAEHALLPGLIQMPLNGRTPTAANWAPTTGVGLVNQYATDTRYKGVPLGEVKSALEQLPNVGAGNVELVALKENAERPNLVTGLKVTFVGAKGEQDMPQVELGQWYTVPPQEVLDRISAAISGLTSGIGGDDDPDAPPPSDFEQFLDTLDPNVPADQRDADTAMGDLIAASLFGGTPVPSSDWTAYLLFKLNIGALIPQVTEFLNSLFPQKLAPSTLEQGEEPTPPQPLCAQGIIEITVTEVSPSSATPPQVGGKAETRGIGFVG